MNGPAANVAAPHDLELVVVINANSFAGAHAGLFVGARLFDPSGTYAGHRISEDAHWTGPALADYLDYHLRDGPEVRLYHFTLVPADFARVLARIEQGGWNFPMFCAQDVQDVLAGIGPFADLSAGRWTSPQNLGERLESMVAGGAVACGTPETRPC